MSQECEDPAFAELARLDVRSIRLKCIEFAKGHTESDDVVRLAGDWAQFVLNGSAIPLPQGGVEESVRADGEAFRVAFQ